MSSIILQELEKLMLSKKYKMNFWVGTKYSEKYL